MKKVNFIVILILLLSSIVNAQIPNLYIRFNLVPAGSGLLTGSQATAISTPKAITFDGNGNPTDAYVMDAPTVATGIYTKTLNLPAGNYEYQVVKADGSGEQSTKITNAWILGRPFTVSEQKDVTFNARLDNGNRRFLCSEQYSNMRISPWTTGSASSLFLTPDENGIARVKYTGPRAGTVLEGVIYTNSTETNTADACYSITDIMHYTGSKKNFSPSKGVVKWVLGYNVNTLAFVDTTYHKLVTLLKDDLISVGGDYSLAGNSTSLGTFSTSIPLSLKGSTTSVSVRTNTTTDKDFTSLGYTTTLHNHHLIAPKNIIAKIYYQILNSGSSIVNEGNQILSTDDMETGAYETIWKSSTPINIIHGLENGNYSIKFWYETVCWGDTIKSTLRTNTFSVLNTDFNWTGTSGTAIDNAENWNESVVPATNTNITVPKLTGETIQYPEVSSNFTVSKLTLKPGANFTINSGYTLTANDTVLLESDNNETAQLLNNGTVNYSNANIVLRKSFNASNGWYFMSFPFDLPIANIKLAGSQTSASTSDFRLATGPLYSDIYIIEYNGERRDQTGTAVSSNSPSWDAVTSGTLQAGKGYAFLVKSDKAIDFIAATGTTGIFDANNKTTTLGLYTTNANLAHQSWNFVGIPYTSSFNLAYLSQNTFYYLYSQVGQNYVVKEQIDNYLAEPFSAFFMQAGSTDATFSTAGRVLQVRALNQTSNYDEINLTISNDNFSDQARIRFNNDAVTGYAINEDAVKMLSPNTLVPQLWSRSEIYDLAVNTVPENVTEIPLSIRIGKEGTYILKLQQPEKISNLEQVLLVDNQENKLVDLKEDGMYSFTSTAEKNTGRFKIITASDVTSFNDHATETCIKLKQENKTISLSGLELESGVSVYNSNGCLLNKFTHVNNGQNLIINLESGLVFIRISNEKQDKMIKMLLK